MHRISILPILTLVLILTGCSGVKVDNPKQMNTLPDIYPDYIGVTIPVNIAPMEFAMSSDDYDAMSVIFKSSDGSEYEAQGDNSIDIDPDEWQQLLSGDSLMVTVRARKNGQWEAFREFPMYVMPDSIDYSIVYRLIAPSYQTYSRMGVYQRQLSNMTETGTLRNTEVTNACINCHTTCQGDPRRQSIHVRGKNGATLIVKDGELQACNTKIPDVTCGSAVYPYWHPSGNYIAYSTNVINQMFHTTSADLMDTFDFNADVYVYDINKQAILLSEALMDTTMFETNPAFSADGKTLYFCRAKCEAMPDNIRTTRFDLCSVSFDPATGRIGSKVDTVICASRDSMSISMPRPSSDGRYLVYCKTDFGGIPVCHHEADLWILNLNTGESRLMTEVNSPDYCDAFHNWSSNNRWMVFGSRREDGTHTLPYFTYIDKNGIGRKPFLLPQHNPKHFYAERMYSYNCVEFVTGPCNIDSHEAADLLLSDERIQWKAERQ